MLLTTSVKSELLPEEGHRGAGKDRVSHTASPALPGKLQSNGFTPHVVSVVVKGRVLIFQFSSN